MLLLALLLMLLLLLLLSFYFIFVLCANNNKAKELWFIVFPFAVIGRGHLSVCRQVAGGAFALALGLLLLFALFLTEQLLLTHLPIIVDGNLCAWFMICCIVLGAFIKASEACFKRSRQMLALLLQSLGHHKIKLNTQIIFILIFIKFLWARTLLLLCCCYLCGPVPRFRFFSVYFVFFVSPQLRQTNKKQQQQQQQQ